jgi:hypothetical protein
MNTTEIIMPIRSAQTQFETAGADSTSIRETTDNNFVQVDGVGGPCYMRVAEYEKYTRMRADWISAGTDQHDAPDPAMMLMATQEEVVELEEEQCRPRSYFRDAFREIEHLVLSCHQSISEDERDDIILTLLSKLMPLREAVLRAEEIWEEGRAA